MCEKCNDKKLNTGVPAISIIIPYYNSGKYIFNCIHSVIIQDFTNFEVICVDDGSTDQSYKIVEHFVSQDARVFNIACEHLGVSHARNVGISLAKGDYLCFIDSDDCLVKNKLKKMYKVSSKNNLDVLIHSAKVIGGKAPKWMLDSIKVKRKMISNYNYIDFFKTSPVIPFIWTHFIKRSIIIDNHILFNESLFVAEDQEFIFHYFKYVNRVQFVTDKCYVHTLRKGSLMSSSELFGLWELDQHLLLVESVVENLDGKVPTGIDNWLFDTIYWSYQRIQDDSKTDCLNRVLMNMKIIDKEKLTKSRLSLYNNFISSCNSINI